MAVLVFEHSNRTGIERLGDMLRDHGHRLNIVHLHEGDPVPPDLDDVDAIVSCGGPQSACDDSIPWISGQMELIRQAHSMQMPVIGLCLGCQLVARALGGAVKRMDTGIEAGWIDVRLTPVGREDPVFAGMPWTSKQISWHADHVATLPPGARLLAQSTLPSRAGGAPVTCIQAWALGLRTYGFQFHPEASVETFLSWVDDEPNALTGIGLTRQQFIDQSKECFRPFERLSERLFEQIALLVMPVDRRYAGVVKDLHH